MRIGLDDGGGRSGLRAQLLEDPAFPDMEAIRRENVHELPTRLTSTRMLAKGILGLVIPSNERTSAAIVYLIRK